MRVIDSNSGDILLGTPTAELIEAVQNSRVGHALAVRRLSAEGAEVNSKTTWDFVKEERIDYYVAKEMVWCVWLCDAPYQQCILQRHECAQCKGREKKS